MPKSENQKSKLLILLRMLERYTDVDHCLSAQEIIERLEAEGIHAERKSIYDDIKVLQDLGYPIELKKTRVDGGYYLKSRDFAIGELKLIADAICASRYITKDRSKMLVDKLETLSNVHQAKSLKRQVYVQNRIKTQNESVYENADIIHTAINTGNKIRFHYFTYGPDKSEVLRKEGAFYVVSPWALTVNDDNYYLVAFDSEDHCIKHYRVDKMKHIASVDEKREGKEFFQQFDTGDYTAHQFGMFGGQVELVTIQFPYSLMGVVIDRFGKEIAIRQRDPEHFSVRVEVPVSNQFYGWLCGLGDDVKILIPEAVKLGYRAHLESILKKS